MTKNFTYFVKSFVYILFIATVTLIMYARLAAPLDVGVSEYFQDKLGAAVRTASFAFSGGQKESGVVIEYLNTTRMSNKSKSISRRKSRKSKYLLDSDVCLIPNLSPFEDGEVAAMARIACTGRPSITYANGSYLRLNWTTIAVQYRSDFAHCQYRPVTRGGKRSDFVYEYGDLSMEFDRDILVPPEHEFLRVLCYDRWGSKISTNFHALVTLKKEVERRSDELFEKHKKEAEPKETFNVIFLGTDSVSRLNAMRRMPRTRDFLLNDLNSFEMIGYTKVADNTFPNMFSLMTGQYLHEAGGPVLMHQPFDRHHIFWKNFSRAGYRTLYAEDLPKYNIYSYLKPGFQDPPTHYYSRPLGLAMEDETNMWNSDHFCIRDKLEMEFYLDYVTNYARGFRDKPHFAFVFLSGLSHTKAEMLSAADDRHLDFLKRFKSEGHLNNTILFYFSDHGQRFGDLRNTYRGRTEDRLPMMHLVFPKRFHDKFPQLVRNLRTNSRRLTTAFDIYATVKDIINFDGTNKKADINDRGISLLREVPRDRTCEHAQINPQWCMCMREENVNTTSKFATNAGLAVVRAVNQILTPAHHKCAKLTLGNITDLVKRESVHRHSLTAEKQNTLELEHLSPYKTNTPVLYQITLRTLPGNALFEATFAYDRQKDHFKLIDDNIGRLNAIGNQARCLSDYKLELYCFCR